MKSKKSIFPKSMRVKKLLSPRVKSTDINELSEDPTPKITNETIAQHRQEVLKGARKYIYPLQHSRHKIVIFTLSILTIALISFMTFVLLSLYKWQSTTAFIYQVTKVVPLPVARVGGKFVPYENYLFEIRHYMHYFENQQQVDFNSEQGQAQLAAQRKKSLESIVNFAYIKKIAYQKNITVSEQEIDKYIELLKTQNKLGTDNKVFENVLKDYWGWTIADFRRSVEKELLTSKVLQSLDTSTMDKAEAALKEIQAGSNFADVAKKYTDDPATKEQGGELGFLVSKNDRNMPPQTIDALYKLKTGEVSGIINLGYGLEIVKNLGEPEAGKIKAARIFFAYKDISKYLDKYKEEQQPQVYIKT